ncbi:hypothetical protein GYMLUDRAFT_248567 [Collybiopsis luxurians FD-317 M1]|uniref:AB hydrolase-1 domain-containing protein n=1 Tax=Collybiopsis luxurians FD-317 M1 TaxID=944289 RepID=A0A0D0BZY0_9AGAR|nr:hypothetical protein GYMLUDRAFT_248567 [Collybiopsis luxurians FD-317 M1]
MSRSGSLAVFTYPQRIAVDKPPDLPKYAYPGRPVELDSVYPPPESALRSKPDLPAGQRKPIWDGDDRLPYFLTTHIVPAAYIRDTPDESLPDTTPKGTQSREERKAYASNVEAKLRGMRIEYETAGPKRHEKVLWVFEPMILSLLVSPKHQSLVEEIWVWDMYNQGDSALLNKGNMNTFMHTSPTRDLLTFLLYFLPLSPTLRSLPTHLPQIEHSEVQRRLKTGFLGADSPRQPMCGVGHSFGSVFSMLAAITHPALFTSLFVMDPVIIYPRPNFYSTPQFLTLGAIVRRSFWKTREEAQKELLRSPFFRGWDRKVLELYIEAGMYRDEDEHVFRLKTPPIQEAIGFNDAEIGSPEAYVRLWRNELDQRITLKWVMPDPRKSELDSRPDASQQRVWLRPGNSTNIWVEGLGHLMVHEKPGVLGDELGKFLTEMSMNDSKAKL